MFTAEGSEQQTIPGTWDTGSVTLSLTDIAGNAYTETSSYGQGTTTASIASDLAARLTLDYGSSLIAGSTGSVLGIKLRAVEGFADVSLSSTYTDFYILEDNTTPPPKAPAGSSPLANSQGITVTQNSDGSITISGASTDSSAPAAPPSNPVMSITTTTDPVTGEVTTTYANALAPIPSVPNSVSQLSDPNPDDTANQGNLIPDTVASAMAPVTISNTTSTAYSDGAWLNLHCYNYDIF